MSSAGHDAGRDCGRPDQHHQGRFVAAGRRADRGAEHPRRNSQSRRLPAPLSIAALFLTAALAGCAGTKRPASVAGGECRIFEVFAARRPTIRTTSTATLRPASAGVGGNGPRRDRQSWTLGRKRPGPQPTRSQRRSRASSLGSRRALQESRSPLFLTSLPRRLHPSSLNHHQLQPCAIRSTSCWAWRGNNNQRRTARPACLRMGMLEWRQPGNCPAGKSARPPA